jgi:RNA polymerase sigma-70 factor (ECF subfamily)
VFSDVFVVAWQRLDAIPADPLPWLLGCARRALLNHHRAARRRSKLIERLAVNARRPSPWPDVHGGRLAEALGLLSEVDREVLLLTAWEGLSTKQSASVLGCSTQAFKVRAYRARKRLADALLNVDGLPPLSQEACNG